jgi:hypothetical protein|tara:strand:- start:283 stop:1203 length:921 start_codon:yes stop_codon:yes gene_type:complete
MANEVSYADLLANGGRVTQVLSALVRQQLYDSTDLRSVMTLIPWNAVGSDKMDVTIDGKPGVFAPATSELVGGITNSDYDTSKFTLNVSRYARQYQVTDLFGITGGPIDIDRVVNKLVEGAGLTMTELLCNLFNSLSNSVGTTGVDLDVDTIYDALFQLNTANASGPYTAVLQAAQMNDFRSALRGETGAIQFREATAETLQTRGPGYQGDFLGIRFYQSDSVDTINAGADYSGAMFVDGCFAYTMAPVRALQSYIPEDNILVDANEVLVELERDASNAMSTCIANMYPSVVEAEDARGVEIVSDV